MHPELKGMKVLHIIDSGGLYGAEKMLLALVKEQVRQGLKPVILSASEFGTGQKPLEIEANRRNLPIINFPMRAGFNFKQTLEIIRWAKAQRYQILHSHGYKFNVLLGMFPKKLCCIPIVSTLHGYTHAPRFSKLWFYHALDRFAIRRIKGIALVGEVMKKEIPKSLANIYSEVIPNGLDISEVERLSNISMGEPFTSFFKSHQPVVLGVGRLSREKGFSNLISAFALLKNRFPKSGLVIVGEGQCRKEFEDLILGAGLREDVLMPGYSSYVPTILKYADLLVMPSHSEGLPITLLEAMALRTSIVASAVGEIPRVLDYGKAGEIINNLEAPMLAGTIERSLINCEISKNRADYAHEIVKKRYSSTAMARNYLIFYSRILET